VRIHGVDFTSRPNARKPIVCATAQLRGDRLRVNQLADLDSLEAFEAWLGRPGPWLAGLDFPFSQPRPLLAALGWPREWSALAAHVATLSTPAFTGAIDDFRAGQPTGRKHLFRPTDRAAGALSPMMVHGVPVGRMFHRGAPCLARSGVHVAPCRPNGDTRVVIESYPALAARRVLGRESYKGPGRPRADRARARLVDALAQLARTGYGLAFEADAACLARARADVHGDSVDAMLCAIQAAWACSQPGFGIPPDADPLEGWIVDASPVPAGPVPG